MASGPAYGPPPHAASGGTSNRGWYIATAVVAVLVIAVVSILIATSGSSSGGGGGGGTAAAGGCDDRSADNQGFSGCMRQLAGAVVANNECKKGAANPMGGQAMETPGATTASCTMKNDYTVMYMHFGGSDKADGSAQSGAETAKQYMDTIKTQFENLGTGSSKADEGNWNGDSMSGSYYAIDIGYGNGVLVFQVKDSPVAGVLMHLSTDVNANSSSSDLVDFFDKHVKPGSDGGA
jgi:hypothetical protein